MTTISSTASFATAWQNWGDSGQNAYVARLAEGNHISVDEAKKQVAEHLSVEQNAVETEAAFARGEGKPVNVLRYAGKYTGAHISETAHKSYEEMTKATELKEAHYMTVQNIDHLLKNPEANEFTLNQYGDTVKQLAADGKAQHADFLFTGAWGNDRVTNSVEEYTGWLKQAAAAYAKTASLSE